ncbi:DUF192 domain-containing protein [Chroococcidiopsis sp. CCALA 051]|uniref:DUF192 domain-containing protein n=1 Tax=Chroococcidiopsis sp. CCALA 051 TaxID=869949 RepID=UPI000D0D1CFF|nr:DUF192 domain-containing protein [Chroococcidiopsis sp. CCALA 051]MBE9018120.1 DUF192 domain-containing protein [Chroococcidiopsidales cyanobacterium LEGE 13417]PSM50813.1 DUF192 domain-containing protein [Chroococcidiopsis sp. CCALA 051]
MLTATQKKYWKISANHAFCIVTLVSGLLLLIIQAQIEKQPQSLPVSAKAQISGQEIELEVAQTAQQQSMGLMYRGELSQTRGMLYTIDPPRPVKVSMQNMRFPVDVVYLQNGQIAAIQVEAQPCDAIACPTYSSKATVDQMIQLRSGATATLGLEVGDRVPIQFL